MAEIMNFANLHFGSDSTIKVQSFNGLPVVAPADAEKNIGRLLINKLDNILYLFQNVNGVYSWRPQTQKQATYVHNQNTVANEWVVHHGLSTRNIILNAWDYQDNEINCDIQFIDDNSFKLILGTGNETKGRVVVFANSTIQINYVEASRIETQKVNVGNIEIYQNQIKYNGDDLVAKILAQEVALTELTTQMQSVTTTLANI